MRSLFWALLIINLAVFFWWRYVQPPRLVAIDMTSTVGGKRLLLLSEVNIEALQAISAAPPSVKPQPTPPLESADDDSDSAEEISQTTLLEPPRATPQCYSLGPFTDAKAAAAAEARLKAESIASQLTPVNKQQADGYMVYLPPFPNRQEAKKVTEALAAQGETDYFVVPSGDNQNAISLGLYRDSEMANQRAEQIRKKGFEPKVMPRMRDKTEFQLNFKWPAERASSANFFQQLAGDAEGARPERISCEQLGVW